MFYSKAAKGAKAMIPPSELFRNEPDKYSKFDNQVSLFKLEVLRNIFGEVCSQHNHLINSLTTKQMFFLYSQIFLDINQNHFSLNHSFPDPVKQTIC